MKEVSTEAIDLLKEIINNEGVPDYWRIRFDHLSFREKFRICYCSMGRQLSIFNCCP